MKIGESVFLKALEFHGGSGIKEYESERWEQLTRKKSRPSLEGD